MRHFFGVGLEEFMGWDETRYEQHKAFAEALLKAGMGGSRRG